MNNSCKAVLATIIAIGILYSEEKIIVIDDISKYEFPSEIESYKISGRKDYEQKGGGYSVRYESDRCKLDIFIYDNNIPGIEKGIKGPKVIAEFKSVVDVMQLAVKKGAYKSAVEDVPLSKNLAALIKGRYLSSAFTIEYASKDNIPGPIMKSITIFKGLGGRFFKARFSTSSDEELKMEPIVNIINKIDTGLLNNK